MKKDDDEEYVFVMFCIKDGPEMPWCFAIVTDEVEAVKAFETHVAEFTDDHIPYVYMQRATKGEFHRGWNPPIELDESRNLFRVPPSMKDRVAG